MKKIFLLFTAVIATLVLLSSCNNSKSEKKSDDESKEKEKIEVKYLEDFAQFQNHEEVKDFFGQGNVVATEWSLAEGTEQYLVSVVHPDQKNKIIIYWKQDSGAYADFAFVEASYSPYNIDWEFIDDEGETYPTKTGLAVGDSIDKLVELNAAPIGFYGLGWDYGGYVFEANKKFTNYTIVLGFSDEYIGTPEGTAAYMNIAGDQEFYSDDAEVVGLPLKIFSITYNRPE